MSKLIFTYLFSFILLASIVAPTYISLSEGDYEITAIADFGEEEEKKGKESAKDLEVKIYYSDNNASLFVSLEKKKRMSFYSKNYTSHYKKLISPPPEHITL
tara:strand:- start:22408 stop:22713 length:306 start_codon:yes stop_codon:yes gene_type:complete